MTFDNLKKELNCNKVLQMCEVNDLLNQYHHISSNTKSLEYIENNILPMKIGNDKIGDDTLILNMSTCLNCYSFKMGYCNANCYGKALQSIYPNSLLYGMASEIMFHKLEPNEMIQQIDNYFLNNELEYLRFNEFGDMKHKLDFVKANKIATHIKKEYGAISYIYTNNQDLDIDMLLKSNLVVNFSYDTKRDDTKECEIITKNQILDAYNDDDCILCDGVCFNCSYCKDKNCLKKVKFVKHGYGQSISTILKNHLSKKQLNNLKAQKFIDYGLFLKNKS